MVRRGNRDNNRPQFDKNRPAGGQQRPVGQGGARPFAPKGRVEVVAPAPVNNNKTDNKKKKDVKTTFGKDEKKGMTKRDLLKRGYAYDSTLEDDSDTARYVKVKKSKKDLNTPQYVKIDHAVLTSERVPIKVFSEKIGKSATEIVKKLFDMGKFATINDMISFEEAELIAIDYDITLELKADKSAEDKLKDIIDTQVDNTKLVKRPPIVTIMGHVDHGKTSLLDYIRKANVAGGEAGGITQHIGAYTIDLNGEKITFLDTPGHEAFTAMRQRGANVTDIAIIVVAADDGIMPQTIEAIHHAKAAKDVSIIVAVNKIDKTNGNYDRILQQLADNEILAEAWGGDTIVCPVSAKTGQGVKELLESVLLVAEVNEYKANKKCSATGSIIEASLDKGKGPVATILVQNGTLKVSDYVVAGTAIGKIRDMTDYNGKRVKEAFPSYAVQVQGFSEVPKAGDLMVVVKDEKLAKKVAQERADKERAEMQAFSSIRSIDDIFGDGKDTKSLNLIIKGDVQGSVEAVKASLLKLNDEMAEKKVKLAVVHSAVGAISESDIMLADTAKAIIIAFNVKAETKAQALAERSKIDIRRYSIIYDAINDMTRALKGMLDPIYKEVSLGEAEVRATFRISSFGTIAGSYVTKGKVARNSKVRVVRDGIIIFEGVLTSLKREKDDVKEVASGYECGIGLEKFNDVKIGDIIESYILEQIEQ
ncbi:MAG: translation initiation factor IF-2 [Clostridia bacterium]|nr:translation initiation factor IF-2 [Clostridia bacterium]